jgi:hypothetical protein
MSTELPDIVAAILDGMQSLTDMSEKNATSDDWRVLNSVISMFVFPGGHGSQELSAQGEYSQTHQVDIRMSLKSQGNEQQLYTDAGVMIPLVLAWFRANDDLGGLVETCHIVPITYTTPNNLFVDSETGVIRKEVTFAVTALVNA